MSRTLNRAGAAAAAIAAGIIVVGCSFPKPPPNAGLPLTPTPRATVVNLGAERAADAPALLIQCVISRGVLYPQGQDWLAGKRVTINSGNAQDFAIWWRAFLTPGPYKQTFVIDGHRTHYLAFGAHWTLKNGQWVPLHRAMDDPLAQRTSLYAWSQWTARNDKLPPQVCGSGLSARQLQAQVYGHNTNNPWGS